MIIYPTLTLIKHGFDHIVTRSWNRTIQACFNILLKDLWEIVATLSSFRNSEPTWVRLMP